MQAGAARGKSAGVASAVALGVAVTVGAVYCATLTDPARVADDAPQYISTARNLLARRGITSDIAVYDLQHRFGRLPVPLTDWPPGFPLLIAAFLVFGASGVHAALWINFLSFFASGLLVNAILRKLEVRRWLRFAGVVLWLAFVPMWVEASSGGSTLPFILATLLGHLSLLCWRDPSSPHTSAWLLGAASAAAAAFTIRYVGVFFVASTLAYAAYASLRMPRWAEVRDLFATALVPGAIIALVLGRNYLLVGSLFSRPQGAVLGEGTGLERLRWSVAGLTGIYAFDLRRGDPVTWIALGGIVVLATLVVFGFARGMSAEDLDRALPAVVYAALMLACLGAIGAARGRPYLDARYLLPVVPFVLIATLHALHCGLPRSAPVAELAVLAGLAAAFCGQAGVFAREFRAATEMLRPYHAMLDDLKTPIGDSTLRRVLEGSISYEHPLLAVPHEVDVWLRLPIVGMSPPEYSKVVWTEDEVRRLIERFAIRQVLVLRDPVYAREYSLPFPSDLKAGRIPDWLRCVHCDERVLLLAVADEPSPGVSTDGTR